MRTLASIASLITLPLTLATTLATGQPTTLASDDRYHDTVTVVADLVASGIPGAGAITQIGTFHTGGPFVEKPPFAAETQPGHVLDRTRLLVASTSNFGAPLALTQPEGSIVPPSSTASKTPPRRRAASRRSACRSASR